MKTTTVSYTVLLLAFLGCSERENPIGPQEPSGPTYLGDIGSLRTYKEVVKWLVPNTDSAFLAVPDSLLSQIQLTEQEVRSGVSSVRQITEQVDTIPMWYYMTWTLPRPYYAYKEVKGYTIEYNLQDHLQAIYQGSPYSSRYIYSGRGRFLETADSIIGISYPYGTSQYLIKPLATDLHWIRDEWTYYDSAAARYRTHNVAARVLGTTNVSVEAGTFEAYKVEITMNWPDLNYTVFWKYEYYVPDVGLVLEESDLVSHIVTFIPGGPSTTIVVRIVSRSELVSFTRAV